MMAIIYNGVFLFYTSENRLQKEKLINTASNMKLRMKFFVHTLFLIFILLSNLLVLFNIAMKEIVPFRLISLLMI